MKGMKRGFHADWHADWQSPANWIIDERGSAGRGLCGGTPIMTNMLEVEDLTKIFVIAKDADLIAVNNISFSLKR
ncbi:MAG TPA: hypothetical protein QF630_00605, partial [Alphaproteobacteria bacterium]|nr:hypothetical protein [Alphaproteobacteria bacterium]